MSKPVLIYLNLRGRAETTRLIFAEAGIDYEDKRVTKEELNALKPTLPLGQVPVLYHDGITLAQSHAIARYAARLAGLYGKDAKEDAFSDMYDDTITDAFVPYFDAHTDEDKKKYFEETLAKCHQKLEEFLTKNGTGYFVGNQLSLGDFAVFQYLDYFPDKLASKALIEFHARIAARPNIAAWIAKRPKTHL